MTIGHAPWIHDPHVNRNSPWQVLYNHTTLKLNLKSIWFLHVGKSAHVQSRRNGKQVASNTSNFTMGNLQTVSWQGKAFGTIKDVDHNYNNMLTQMLPLKAEDKILFMAQCYRAKIYSKTWVTMAIVKLARVNTGIWIQTIFNQVTVKMWLDTTCLATSSCGSLWELYHTCMSDDIQLLEFILRPSHMNVWPWWCHITLIVNLITHQIDCESHYTPLNVIISMTAAKDCSAQCFECIRNEIYRNYPSFNMLL